jgi:hypothetical protein
LFCALSLLAALAACAVVPGKQTTAEPAWFQARQSEVSTEAYPDLRDIPPPPAGMKSQAEWGKLREELREAGAAVLADPNARPADVADVPDFETKARTEAQRPLLPPTPKSP